MQDLSTKSQFSELSYDDLFSILDQLDLIDLFSFAEISPEFLAMVARTRHFRTIITIKNDPNVNREHAVFHSSDRMFIYDYKLTLSVLENFGSSILNIRHVIYKHDEKSQVEQIVSHINLRKFG